MKLAYMVDALFLAQQASEQAGETPIGVSVSLDGEYWTQPANVRATFPAERLRAFHFEPILTRFVRFTLLEDTGPEGWKIGEIYAYGERPPIVTRQDIGWSGAAWSPAQVELLAMESHTVALTFLVDDPARLTRTLRLNREDTTIAQFQVDHGREVLLGPLAVAPGSTQLELLVLPEEAHQDADLLAVENLRLIYLKPD